MSVVNELMQRALLLSVEERELLVDQLLESLQTTPNDPDYDKVWMRELQARMEQVDQGVVKPIPWREALEQIRLSRQRGAV